MEKITDFTFENGRPYFFYEVSQYNAENFKNHDLKIEITNLKKKADYIALLHNGMAYPHPIDQDASSRVGGVSWSMKDSKTLCLEEKCFDLDAKTGKLYLNGNFEGSVIKVSKIESPEKWQAIDQNLKEYFTK